MEFDLDSLSEQQLRHLNHEIVRRLQAISAARRTSALAAFRVGDRVAFDADHGAVTGIIVRINQKTASIETDEGRGWRVSPGALSKISGSNTEVRTNLFHLQSRQTRS